MPGGEWNKFVELLPHFETNKNRLTFVAFVAMPGSPFVTSFANCTMPVRIVFQQIPVTKWVVPIAWTREHHAKKFLTFRNVIFGCCIVSFPLVSQTRFGKAENLNSHEKKTLLTHFRQSTEDLKICRLCSKQKENIALLCATGYPLTQGVSVDAFNTIFGILQQPLLKARTNFACLICSKEIFQMTKYIFALCFTWACRSAATFFFQTITSICLASSSAGAIVLGFWSFRLARFTSVFRCTCTQHFYR